MASVQLHVKPEFNPEEAAHAAADIVGNLENLPGEVSFLLQEIREKDIRIETLLTRIHTRHYGLTKTVKRANDQSQGPSSSQPNLPIPPGGEIPIDHLSQKEAQNIQKIQGEWEKIEILQEEKVKLADRMERIVARARERARAEWVKVGGIDVEELVDEGGAGGGGEIVLPASGLGSGSDVRQRKRKPQALPLPLPSSSSSGHIFHPPSSMPPPPAPSRPSLSARSSYAQHPSHGHGQKGRASRKSTSVMSEDGDGEDVDMDAEGEMEEGEADAEGVETDNTPYCVCRKPSHGEMIGCDNDRCEIEWFHLGCVGIKEAPETWYCPACVRKLGLSSSDGSKPGRGAQKGRKR